MDPIEVDDKFRLVPTNMGLEDNKLPYAAIQVRADVSRPFRSIGTLAPDVLGDKTSEIQQVKDKIELAKAERKRNCPC